MSIAIYADESGTHDPTGKRPRTEVATICGFMGWKNKWGVFSRQWEAHLRINGIKVFHTSEFNDSKRYPDKYGDYRGWNERRKDAFVRGLAEIASKHTICPVGGNFATRWSHDEAVLRGQQPEYPYGHCFDMFFKSVLEELDILLPGRSENLLFFFDQNSNPAWQQAMNDSWNKFAKLDRRFVMSPATGDKRVFIPLQAADLIANHTRSIASPAWGESRQLGTRGPNKQPMDSLTQILFRKMRNINPGKEWAKTP